MTFTPVADPVAFLVPPTSSGAGMNVSQLRENAGLVAGTVDAIVDFFTGFSMLEEWIAKPLAGDWDALARAGDAWGHVAKASDAVVQNITVPIPVLAREWLGEAAEAYANSLGVIAQAFNVFRPACEAMQLGFQGLTLVSATIAKLLMQAVREVVDLALAVSAAAASPPLIGTAVLVAALIKLARAIGRWTRIIQDAIRKFIDIVKQIAQKIAVIRGMIQGVQALLAKAQAALAAAGFADEAGALGGFGDTLGQADGMLGKAEDEIDKGIDMAEDVSDQVGAVGDKIEDAVGA